MSVLTDLDAALSEAAQNAPPPPALAPYPGWAFCIEERNATPQILKRLSIWSAFKKDAIRTPVPTPWYAGLELGLVLGNDLSRCAYVCGSFEPNEFYYLSTLLRPGMVVVDAGANEGLYSLFAARMVGPSGRVLCVEPSPREYQLLSGNIQRNDLTNATICRLALGATAGSATLRVAEDEHAGQNTLGNFIYNIQQSSEIDVEVVSLDELVAVERLPHVDLLKMDVEGAEYAVLAGAREVLQRYRPVVLFEMAEEALKNQGADSASLLSVLRDHRYRLLSFGADGLPAPLQGEPSHNLIAVPY